MRRIPATAAVLLLAGCLAQGPQTCVDVHCAAQTDLDYDAIELASAQQVHGLEYVEGKAFLWVHRDVPEGGAADLLWYDFDSRTLGAIEAGETKHSTNLVRHGGQIAYLQSNVDESDQRVNIWGPGATSSTHPWPTKGIPVVRGYDGEWILAAVFAGGNDTGEYALNIADGRLLQLYKSMATPTAPNGTGELVDDLALAPGRAFISFLWNRDTGNRSRSMDFDSTTYVYNLSGNAGREFYHRFDKEQTNYMEVGDRYIVWGTVAYPEVTKIWAKDLVTGSMHGPWSGPGGYDMRPQTAGDWLCYITQGSVDEVQVVAVHVPTNRSVVLVPSYSGFNTMHAATDGEYVAFTGWLLDEHGKLKSRDGNPTTFVARVKLPEIVA